MKITSECGYTGPVRGGYVSQSADRWYADGKRISGKVAKTAIALSKGVRPFWHEKRGPGCVDVAGLHITNAEYEEAKIIAGQLE